MKDKEIDELKKKTKSLEERIELLEKQVESLRNKGRKFGGSSIY